ncbi:MAG: GNAT family N-acetyltransferase [Clostridiales bacterium]|jgi:ribosomal protein S18 acetylase RimI-like enzyme|nr:GNAT family N-acetyltransferase [Clostridiales bacterium]
MFEINEIFSPEEKSKICNEILRSLPEWFGIEASIVDYVQQVQSMPFYAAFDCGMAVGFVAIKIHSKFSSEICVIGILKTHHSQGIGKKLIECCELFCKENKIEFLTVKTLDESRECEEYNKTRLFYLSAGFKPLEVFPTLWDEDNPCLLMAKCLRCMVP